MKVPTLVSCSTGLVAVLLPKCPLCIAAWLSVLGVSTSVAGVLALVLAPTLWSVAVVVAGLGLWRWARVRRARVVENS